MRRCYRVVRGAAQAALLLVVACDSPGASVTEEVDDDVVLTREQPVAAFEVRLCLSADAPPEIEGNGAFDANARLNEGTAELTVENLDVDADYQSPQGQNPPTATETLEADAASMGVILTLNPSGLSSGQCTDTQVVQFTASGLEDEQAITLSRVEGFFGGEWTNSLCGSDLSSASLQLEVEQI